MKTYKEICNEIKKTRAAMKDTAKTEKELNKITLRDAWKSGDAEQIEAAKKQYKKAEEKYIKELQHNTRQKLKIEILRDNAANAFFTENIHTICDIWNKYEGKPHGEKTSEKIRTELKAATGIYIYIRNSYRNAEIACSFPWDQKPPFGNLTFFPNTSGNEAAPALIDNKCVKLDPGIMRVSYCGAYVEDVEKHLDEIEAAHAVALEAENALKAACSKYNVLLRGNMNRADARNGVKNYII